MLNLPHSAMLEQRGTVTMTAFRRKGTSGQYWISQDFRFPCSVSYLDLFGQLQRIFLVDPQVANGAL